MNLNTQSDAVAMLFNGEGLFSFDKLMELTSYDINRAQQDRQYLFESRIAKWKISEIYGHLKKAGELPELPIERKREIWAECNGDKLLAYSLYVIEII